MPSPVWQDVRQEFEFDGSWRDIYVLNATITDWQLVLDFLQSTNYPLRFSFDGTPAAIPPTASEVFSRAREATALLVINVAAIEVCCHFFTSEEIEFDIDPRQVRGDNDLDAVFDFMHSLARVTVKTTILTPENCELRPIFRILPTSEFVEYVSA